MHKYIFRQRNDIKNLTSLVNVFTCCAYITFFALSMLQVKNDINFSSFPSLLLSAFSGCSIPCIFPHIPYIFPYIVHSVQIRENKSQENQYFDILYKVVLTRCMGTSNTICQVPWFSFLVLVKSEWQFLLQKVLIRQIKISTISEKY